MLFKIKNYLLSGPLLVFAFFTLTACGGGGSSTKKVTIPEIAPAGHLYVAVTGSDDNVGSQSKPFKTIQKAADSAVAGNTVFIKEGVYHERVILPKSGTEANKITFKRFAKDSVVIDGSNIAWGTWGGLFDISNQSNIVVSGITLKNSTHAGFFLDQAQNIVINNSKTYNTFSSGIGVWASKSVIIDDNEIELACNDGGEESLTIAGSSHVQVSHNNVHHNGAGTIGGEGIDIKDGSHDVNVFANHVHDLNNRICIYMDAWDKYTHHINVYGNRVHHCTDSGIAVATEMGGLIDHVSIYNNIVYSNKYGGIEVGSWTADKAISITPVENITIINNTVFNNADGINIENAYAKNITIRNNIVSQNKSTQIVVSSTPLTEVTVDHNLLYSPKNIENEAFKNQSVLGDPKFKHSDKGDFRLTNGSPAIDAGAQNQAPQIDFIGANRPNHSRWDIGAFEY